MTTQDKEAVEAVEKLHAQISDRTMFEKAQQKMVEFVPLSAECTPDENMRRVHMQHAYLTGFISGTEWQKQRERPHDCQNQQINPVEQCQHEDCRGPGE